MQTFLPYPDFARSAKCLDRLRLGKQRVECKQIIQAIVVPGSGWSNHPAVNMWRGHMTSLLEYQHAMITEWVRRGFKNTMEVPWMLDHGDPPPPWLENPVEAAILTRSHKSNLLRKNSTHYGRMNWDVPNDIPYYWPRGRDAL